jgi:hypothetical protein
VNLVRQRSVKVIGGIKMTKITVITNDAGMVLGTFRHADPSDAGLGRLVAGAGQVAHEIELTDAMVEADSPETLHGMLEDHLGLRGR